MKVRFGSFVLDSGARQLLKGRESVHLSPKAFDVLEILVARRPNVVSKEVLLDEVWPGKVVEEANLAMAVGEMRKALGEDSKSPALVVTLSGAVTGSLRKQTTSTVPAPLEQKSPTRAGG